jgi:hypothetical protein
MNYFNPPVILRSETTGAIWSLGIKDGKLALVDKYRGVHLLTKATNYTVIERQPVAGWLTGVLLDVWLQFAHRDGDELNAGGLSALEDVEEALRCASLINEDGQPIRALTLAAGAGGMEER